MRNTTTFALSVLLAAGTLRAAPSGAAPTVTVAATSITATGITPGAQVLFFGAGFEPKGRHAIVHRWSTVVNDSDGDGTVSYVLDPPVSWNALWIVADLRNGHCAVAATPGFPVARAHLAKREFKRGLGAAVTRFVYSRSAVDFLYVVPGGAWSLLARDGDSTDGDNAVDGATVIDLSRLQPVNGVEAPRAFHPGGTLFVIDSSRLDLLEVKLDGSILAEAR